jgi:hypothetical protein
MHFMPKDDIDKSMMRTKSKDKDGNITGPWATDYIPMAIKTVIRKLMKMAPVSVDEKRPAFNQAIHAEDLALDIGPSSQQQLFLPEGKTEVKEPEPEDFDAEFKDLSGQYGFEDFLKEGAKSSDVSVDEFKVMVLTDGDQLSFREAFKHYQEQRPPKQKGKPVKKTTRGKKSEGGSKGGSKKTQQKAAEKPEPTKEPDTIEDLMQTDEWQEMTLLQDQNPELYIEVKKEQGIKGRPKDLDTVNKVIEKMTEKIEGTGEGIPGA